MATTIKQTESIPASYPDTAPYPHWNNESYPDDASIENALIWQRIESYIAHRWTARNVVWIVEGPGEWTPPLTPATISQVEVWNGSAWETVSIADAPLGFELPGDGPYRFSASVGSGDVPEAVQEAFRRLHEFSKGIAENHKNDAAYRSDDQTEVFTGWTGKALQLSGAADLLRPYRRA
ncbi:hypothetical protein [Cohaesibacter intestini]|uniref:hypothetical protein n=1 Tax=Cohaesibacter intestini TaxID=2211145 RepID=UPI000DE836AD|nr:hypothetical protein [Cohaesibacter intestini]